MSESTSGSILPNEKSSFSSHTIEAISKCVVLVPALLYGVGLFIANISAQSYGRLSLGLVDAQYILVGLLWMVLLMLTTGAVHLYVGRFKDSVLRDGLSIPARIRESLLTLPVLGTIATSWYWIMHVLGARLTGWMLLIDFFVPAVTGYMLASSLRDTWGEIKLARQKGQIGPFVFKQIEFWSISRMFSVLVFVSVYSLIVFPDLNPAFGGGKLHQIEIGLRPAALPILETLPEFKVNNDGRLGPVNLVSESDQFLIIVPFENRLGSPALYLKKDLVDFVVYPK